MTTTDAFRPATGVVFAMYAEGTHLLALADEQFPVETGIYPSWRLRFGSVEVVAVQSGIGMVRAAAATQHMISRWDVSSIMNFGCTGAHAPDINLGDVIVGDRSVPHFNIQIRPDGSERYVGFITEEGADLAHVDDMRSVASDPSLVEQTINAGQSAPIEPWPGSSTPPRLHVGAVASADIWTQELNRLSAFNQQHQTLCEDMESAAISKIASLHGIPYLTVKDISNNEFQKATNLEDFTQFPVDEVGKRAALVLAALLRSLGS